MDDRDSSPPADLALLTDAVARWHALVRARREQFDRLRAEQVDPGAYWRARSRNYYSAVRGRAEPDPFVRAVLEACRDAESLDARWATGAEPPPATVLDVGGGFGAVAVPVARTGRRVTVVEPHPSMVELLGEWATEEGVSDRVGVVQEPWPLAAPMGGQHDIVVCSHVLYPIEDVVPFVGALLASTRRACLITLRVAGIEQAPAELFRELHGEDRVPQPGFADLCAVLFQQGLSFESSTYETETTWSYADLDEAVAVVAEGLLVAGRPEALPRIRAWAAEALASVDGRLATRRRTSMAGIARLVPQPTRS